MPLDSAAQNISGLMCWWCVRPSSKVYCEDMVATKNLGSVVGLFAGIGGLELAFSRAGFGTDLLVELDDAARRVLAARFADVEIQTDVADLDALPHRATILTAGFPCQNLSMAGDKRGLKGNKSSVVKHMFRLIARSNIETVVIENVNFMLNLNRGAAMSDLVADFERLGFRWAYRVFDTMDFGLPQRRRRVYMVASRGLDPRIALFGDDIDGEREKTPRIVDLDRPIGFYWTEGRSGVGLTVDAIPPLKVGSSIGIASAPAVYFPEGEVLMPSLVACERLQGFPAGWTDVEGGLPGKRPGWRLIGNAVSVPVATSVAQRLREGCAVPDLDARPLDIGQPWPSAAWNVGHGHQTPYAHLRPTPVLPSSIRDFRDADWSRLSNRALDGFIGRAAAGGLNMPVGFLDALRAAERRPALSSLSRDTLPVDRISRQLGA